MTGLTFSVLFTVYALVIAFATGWHELFFQELREGHRGYRANLDKRRKKWLVAMQVIAMIFPVAMYQTFDGPVDDNWQWWANYVLALVVFAFFRFILVSYFTNVHVYGRRTFDLSDDANANAVTDKLLNGLSYSTRAWGSILGLIAAVVLFFLLNTIWYYA